MARYTLTARIAGEVSHERFDDLESALDELERRGHTLQGAADADSVGGSLVRRFQPEDQVTARLELRGPSRLRLGVDVRGDGSAVAFTGKVVRKEIDRRNGETAYDALRRVSAD